MLMFPFELLECCLDDQESWLSVKSGSSSLTSQYVEIRRSCCQTLVRSTLWGSACERRISELGGWSITAEGWSEFAPWPPDRPWYFLQQLGRGLADGWEGTSERPREVTIPFSWAPCTLARKDESPHPCTLGIILAKGFSVLDGDSEGAETVCSKYFYISSWSSASGLCPPMLAPLL